ncbi:MAG: GNAT family N-acetyltransferase [Deltaproteobacteria bacterium]|nr:GNAT family N-acetyltransferase [Deltaproteobacteria bacterium]
MQQALQRFQIAVDQTYVRFKLLEYRQPRVAPKIPLFIDTTYFTIKTVDKFSELQEVLRLRYDVFLREGLNKTKSVRVDIDRFDSICDHLIIVDKRSNQIVGTYRLICSSFSDEFYSESEFDLDPLLGKPGIKLELGRACIHKEFRKGTVIAMLWKGITEYAKLAKAHTLFGCASVQITDFEKISQIYQFLREQRMMSEDLDIRATKKYRVEGLREYVDSKLNPADYKYISKEIGDELIPSLLRSYFKAGAKIGGEPALDQEFKCIDLLTILKTDQMSESFERKYKIQ